MITLNSKLEQILISSFGKKIVLEMQELILEKPSIVIQTNYMEGDKKDVHFLTSVRQTKDWSLHHYSNPRPSNLVTENTKVE